jgi:hypothetical protein
MKNSKILFTSLLCVFVLVTINDVSAQDREIGIKMNGLDNFNLVYKKKKTEDKYRRYEAAFLNTNFQGTAGQTVFTSAVGFSGGIEKRKGITDKLKLAHGFLPGIFFNGFWGFNANNGSGTFNVNISPRLGYALGLQYHFNDKFYLGLESIPSLTASVGFSENQVTSYSVQTNISLINVGLSAVYRF